MICSCGCCLFDIVYLLIGGCYCCLFVVVADFCCCYCCCYCCCSCWFCSVAHLTLAFDLFFFVGGGGVGWLFCVFMSLWFPSYSKTAVLPAISEAFPLFSPKTPFLKILIFIFLLLLVSPPFLLSSFIFTSVFQSFLKHLCLCFFQNTFVKPSLFQTHLVFGFDFGRLFFLLCFWLLF